MLPKWLLLALLFLTLKAANQDFVRSLNKSSFADFVSSHKRVLVEFYTPWCEHCKAMQLEFEKAAKRLQKDGAETFLVKIDISENSDLSAKYSINNLPTIKYFVNGDLEKAEEYNGGKKEGDIVTWVVKNELPVVTILQASEVEDFTRKHKICLIAYLTGDATSNSAIGAVFEVANAMREEIVVGLVQSEDGF
ncbi:protein disulfide-isomerase precursor [Reticulomyxa filosa]|uniref:Protein disulfide-isomerase n=1 Tax=Reticulomyxa filosa TaxID=46433 RepID=X6MPG8_RETFI|nr:protein disulfide-isomerase precursor [Reticulomyxa filosa]|eukprot:ETO14970.1 protein disulfide-isomerase precursor [Reticulomyxa filosa]